MFSSLLPEHAHVFVCVSVCAVCMCSIACFVFPYYSLFLKTFLLICLWIIFRHFSFHVCPFHFSIYSSIGPYASPTFSSAFCLLLPPCFCICLPLRISHSSFATFNKFPGLYFFSSGLSITLALNSKLIHVPFRRQQAMERERESVYPKE